MSDLSENYGTSADRLKKAIAERLDADGLRTTFIAEAFGYSEELVEGPLDEVLASILQGIAEYVECEPDVSRLVHIDAPSVANDARRQA